MNRAILISLLALAAVPGMSRTVDSTLAYHYYEGGAPWECVEDMTLFFSERRIKIDCYRNGDDYRKKANATLRRDHVCTEKEWRTIEEWIHAARIDEWDEAYAPGVPDGTVWRLEFLSGTNVIRRFEGVNNWPERFHEFRKVKDFAMKLPEETHAEAAETQSHAEFAEAAKAEPHAEFVESAEAPSPVPDPATIVRYERLSREDGDGEPHAVSKADGDEILDLLKDWRLFEDCRPKPAPGEPYPCVLPAPPTLVLTCFRTDGSSVEIEFFRYVDCKTRKPVLEVRPPSFSWQRRIPGDSARALLEKFDAWEAADRAAFLAVPLPRTYVFGTTSWDGGTLSGVAKLFYGNGNKWRVIWEANKAAVPNPDYVLSGTPLVIPAPPSEP